MQRPLPPVCPSASNRSRHELLQVSPRILFVDDEQAVLNGLRRMLRPYHDLWEMRFTDRPEAAWEQLLGAEFDVVVLDVRMPGMSGLELLGRMRQNGPTKDVPVVLLSGLSDHHLKRQALDLGATDVLNKPVAVLDLLARLRSTLRLKSYQDELKACNQRLEQTVQERTEALYHSRLDIIWRLGKAAEYRDEETGNHVIRVGCSSRIVAEALGMDRHFVETLFLAAPLHDIGKIGIPDRILRKEGPLSPGQWALMKQHCAIGARILREDCKIRAAFRQWRGTSSASETEGFGNPFLEMAADIALSHHEWWDGGGYPQGRAGEAIPLEARIVALCDAFDAMTSRRPYKEAYPEEDALKIIGEAVGTQFDPYVYAAFVEALPEVLSIRERFADVADAPHAPEEPSCEKNPVCR